MTMLSFWAAAAAAASAPDPPSSLDPPGGLGAYSYGGGLNYGISWGISDSAAETELFVNGSSFATAAPMVENYDVGIKPVPPLVVLEVWKARHLLDGEVSAFSDELTLENGEPI